MSVLGSQWSGPIPGQTVMGVHDATHGIPTSHGDFTPHEPFEVDRHGFVFEGEGLGRRATPSADKAAGNPSARNLYRSYGGGHDSNPSVRADWEKYPVVNVRSDTPVHTHQDFATTEFKQTAGKRAGRDRIEGIKKSLQAGDPIKEPVWLVHQSGRLYAMDGHHRMVAAREAGLSHYPARIRNMDT